jgi:predicted ribonuclease YlaK
MKYVIDTNTLLSHYDSLIDYDIVITSHIHRELEKLEFSKDEAMKFLVRTVKRFLRNNEFEYDLRDYHFDLNQEYDPNYTDNKILQAAHENGFGIITHDNLLFSKAKGLGIEVIDLYESVNNDYVGYKEVSVSDAELANVYENLNVNHFDLYTNQYLLLNHNGEVVDALRWDGQQHVRLKLPSSKVVKAKNKLQECALDLLNNPDIPIKVLAGTFGSGKTLLNIRMAVHHVTDKPTYNKIMVVRNPVGPTEGIGWLPGRKDEKINWILKPIEHQLDGGEQELESLIQQGKIEMEVPYFMKGMSLNGGYWVAVDEAEDLDLKTFKLIGSRIGEGSCVVFSGDYNQTERKYIQDNGLTQFINRAKGNPLVGIVVLKDDVRSQASKVFADL